MRQKRAENTYYATRESQWRFEGRDQRFYLPRRPVARVPTVAATIVEVWTILNKASFTESCYSRRW